MTNCNRCLFQTYNSSLNFECQLCTRIGSGNNLYIAGVDNCGVFPLLSGFKSEEDALVMLGQIKHKGVDAQLLKWNEKVSAFTRAAL